MSGTVSAGAYTAGVLNVLLRAISAWNLMPNVPHSVRISVLSGASGGAITAALVATALASRSHLIEDVGANSGDPLFNAWVESIDVRKLLDPSDLTHRVQSLLNSEALDAIALEALSFRPSAESEAPNFVTDPLPIFISVTNLDGTSIGPDLVNHSEIAGFQLSWSKTAELPVPEGDLLTFVSARDSRQAGWKILAETALASAAFPVALSARKVNLPRKMRSLALLVDDRNYTVRFQADETVPDQFLAVDGGVVLNRPLRIAHQWLNNFGEPPREFSVANRAIIVVEPFLGLPGKVPDPYAEQSMTSILFRTFKAAVAQARFSPIELKLLQDPSVASYFVINPVRQRSREHAPERSLMADRLGGFAGFLDPSFRLHDFQLGMVDAQRFLRNEFLMSSDNPLFGRWEPGMRAKYSTLLPTGESWLPIVPLTGRLEQEIHEPPLIRPDILQSVEIRKAIKRRLTFLVPLLIDELLARRCAYRLVARLAWVIASGLGIKRALVASAMQHLGRELAQHS